MRGKAGRLGARVGIGQAQAPAMQLRHRTHQGQPQPGARRVARLVGAEEALTRPALILRAQPGA